MSFLKYFFTGVLLIALIVVNNTAFAENAEAEAHNRQGDTYYNANNYQQALEEYNAALNLDDKNALYHSNRGWANYNLKNYDEAMKDFNKAIQLNEDFAEAYDGRACIYRDQGKNESAEENFRTAGDKYYYSANYSEALSSFYAAVNINGNAINYSNCGWANYNLKNIDEAMKDFNKAIQLDNFAEAYDGRAYIYRDQGKIKEAVSDFLKAGVCYYNLKQYDEARTDFDNAIKLDANCEEARFYLALMAQDIEKNPHTAIEKYTEIINAGIAHNPEIIYTNRGSIYCEINEYDKAIDDFTKAIELNPTYIQAYVNRANVYDEQLKDYGKAFVDYKEILRINEAKKELTDEQKEDYEKKAELCWDSMSSSEQAALMVSNPNATGKVSGLMKILVIFMMIEFVLSNAYAIKSGTLTAKFAFQKFLQKAIFVIIVLAIMEVDEADLMEFSLKNPIIILFLLYEILSVLENAGNLGVPIPEDLKNLVQSIISKIKELLRLD